MTWTYVVWIRWPRRSKQNKQKSALLDPDRCGVSPQKCCLFFSFRDAFSRKDNHLEIRVFARVWQVARTIAEQEQYKKLLKQRNRSEKEAADQGLELDA